MGSVEQVPVGRTGVAFDGGGASIDPSTVDPAQLASITQTLSELSQLVAAIQLLQTPVGTKQALTGAAALTGDPTQADPKAVTAKPDAAAAPAPAPATTDYTIQRGDTLSALADRFHTTVGALVDANHISNPDLIITGDHLTIPGGGGAAGAGSTDAMAAAPSTPADATEAPPVDPNSLNAPVESAAGGDPDLLSNVRVVASVATEKGVDPAAAVAMMLVESGGDEHAVGDGGTSFGLFQLHRGGMLGDRTKEQAFDPRTNAEVSLSSLAAKTQEEAGAGAGKIAADSQRPADRAGYARKVDGNLGRARDLLTQAGAA